MWKSNSDDVFKYNCIFKNDIIFSELPVIHRYLVFAIIQNIDMFVDIAKRQTFEKEGSSIYFTNAGMLFNILDVATSIDMMTQEELYKFASCFRKALIDGKYKEYCQKVVDPIKVLKQFTKYYYIPVRLDYNSIPDNVQTEYLQRFLTIVAILLSNSQYINKLQPIYPELLQKYQDCYTTLQRNPAVMQKLISTNSYDNVERCLLNPVNSNNNLQFFEIGLSKLVIEMSIEITGRMCPSFANAFKINNKFDGIWLDPFDNDIQTQTNQLRKIIEK